MTHSKEKTREQAAATQAKAVRFLRDVVGDEAKAGEIESLSVEEYAERKRLRLINPADAGTTNRREPMAEEFDDDALEGEETDEAPDFGSWLKPELVEQCLGDYTLKTDIWGAVPEKPLEDCTREELEEALDEVVNILNADDPEAFPLFGEDEDAAEDEAA